MDVLVIGGGASGIMAAISAAECGAAVRILEKNDRIGRKILATGNGRCNYTNINCISLDFMGSSPEFTGSALANFDIPETLAFFEKLGIVPREESEGRIYPYSEQAASVLDAFTIELARLKVEIVLNSSVKSVKKSDDKFLVLVAGGKQYQADKVILASGGKAGAQYGCQGDGYIIARDLGHKLIEPRPALNQVVSDAGFFSQLKGVRAKGKVTLMTNPKENLAEGCSRTIAQETGEIQFTETGLSGICIFNLSRHIINGGEIIQIDLIPELSLPDLQEKLFKRLNHFQHKALAEFLNGIINKKLIPVILKECKVAGVYKNCASLDKAATDKIAGILKAWPIRIIGTKGWQDAQTSAGGVDTGEIEADTMESKMISGLYFAGEIIDVDGRCGGYNLQWAWTSGFIAGRQAGGC